MHNAKIVEYRSPQPFVDGFVWSVINAFNGVVVVVSASVWSVFGASEGFAVDAFAGVFVVLVTSILIKVTALQSVKTDRC